MTKLIDMDLPEIDIFDPEYARDPHAVYDEARKKSWIAKYQFGYLLLDYDDMRTFLRNDEQCREPNLDIIEAWNAHGTPFARFTGNQMVAKRGAEHKRLRDLVAPAFTPRAANKHREFMRETITQVLDKYMPLGKCDFAELAAEYPITVMCRLIGVDAKDVQKFAKWLEPQEAAFGMDPSILPELNEATDSMYTYVSDVIAARQQPGDHPDDLLQDLVELAKNEDDALTDEELKTLLILLLGAGFDTTKNQLNLVMKMLVDYPDQVEKLLGDPDHLKPFINETLRFKNALGSLHRLLDEDIEHRGVTIPANNFISIPITYHGRDATKFENPAEFDTTRKGPPHMAFGQGMHICLGQFLARALLEEGLPLILERMKNFALDGEIVYRSPLAIWGYKSLPMTYDAETA